MCKVLTLLIDSQLGYPVACLVAADETRLHQYHQEVMLYDPRSGPLGVEKGHDPHRQWCLIEMRFLHYEHQPYYNEFLP